MAQKRSWKKWVFRPLMVAAALLLFILLGPGLIFELNLNGQNNHLSSIHGWHISDLPAADTFAAVPFANIPRGQVLLLPTNLQPDAYLVAANINTYGAAAPLKGYLIFEQNALIYESPSPSLPAIAYSDSAYQVVHVGNTPVFVAHTRDGQNRLGWYQYGLLCDFVSDQPVKQMVAMVQALQPITY